MKSEQENECTYAEKFRLDPISFDGIRIDGNTCELSTRTISRLLRYKILTAGDLLRVKESDLREINGFGQKCADEVSAFLQTLTEDRLEIKTPQKKMPGEAASFRCYRDDICTGEFSFAQELELTDDEKSFLYAMREGYDLLGQELVTKAIYDPDSLFLIRKLLLDIGEKQKERQKLVKLVEEIPEIEDLPQIMLTTTASGNLKEKKKTQKELRGEYATLVFGLAMFISSYTYNITPAIKNLLISGYTQRRDRDGNLTDDYIYSIKFTRDMFEKKNVSNVDPIEFCMSTENRCNMTTTSLFKKIKPYDEF